MKRDGIGVAALMLLAACQNSEERAQDRVEDRIERSTDVDAEDQAPAPGALGLNEAQLLAADLVSASGDTLGRIAAVRRDGAGDIAGLVVEIDDAGTARQVEIPIEGLSTTATTPAGNTGAARPDVLASMTLDELASFPDAAS